MMKQSRPNLPFVFILLLSLMGTVDSLHGDVTYYLLGGRNGGELLEETGSKYPAVYPGFSGGSRITYSRDMPYGGVGIRAGWRTLEAELSFTSSFAYVDPGATRDEDFFLYSTSAEYGSKIDLLRGSVRDTPYTFSGLRDYADAKAPSRLYYYGGEGQLRYFPGESETGVRKGGYLSTGYRYSFQRDHVFDAHQYYATYPAPTFMLLPGHVLSFREQRSQFLAGGGYRLDSRRWLLDASFQMLLGYSFAQDDHILRNLKFAIETTGSGFVYRLRTLYHASDRLGIGATLYGIRYFSEGSAASSGGITETDILSTYMGRSRIYINTKESGVEFSAEYRTDGFSVFRDHGGETLSGEEPGGEEAVPSTLRSNRPAASIRKTDSGD